MSILKHFKDKYSKKVNKAYHKEKKKIEYKWIIVVTLLAFSISFLFSFISETIVPNVNAIIALVMTLLFIGIGIIFDMIGIAITVADIKTFNSMATKRVKGSKLAVKFIMNSEKASSFCNDVIGDICGIISGSTGIALSTMISKSINTDLLLTTLVTTALIAAMTIGGKAIGKSMAINNSTPILFKFSKVISIFYRI